MKSGWKTYRFDQIAINVSDRVEPGDVDVEHYVGLEHLDSESLKIRRWGTPDDVEATKLRFRNGDIIFGRRRVYQRKLAVAEFDGICSAHAMVLRPKTNVVLPEFLPFFMQSDVFMNRALEISVGSLSPTINWRTLAKQEFALPPLEEQHRIASLLASMEETLTQLREAHASTRQLWRSLSKEEFGFVESNSAEPLEGHYRIRYQSAQHRWQKYCEEAGIDCTLHQLRHSHATELVNEGVSLATIRKRLGHKNIQTTLRYAEKSDESADAELRAWRRRKINR